MATQDAPHHVWCLHLICCILAPPASIYILQRYKKYPSQRSFYAALLIIPMPFITLYFGICGFNPEKLDPLHIWGLAVDAVSIVACASYALYVAIRHGPAVKAKKTKKTKLPLSQTAPNLAEERLGDSDSKSNGQFASIENAVIIDFQNINDDQLLDDAYLLAFDERFENYTGYDQAKMMESEVWQMDY